MDIKTLTDAVSVSGQITSKDLAELKKQGVKTIINNRPDNEQASQPLSETLERAAKALDLNYHFIPVTPGNVTDEDAAEMARIIAATDGKTHAFCRTGNRSSLLWQRGLDLAKSQVGKAKGVSKPIHHTIVVVGGGSAGIAAASSLLKRKADLDIAIIEPSEDHYYQPGWTMVGGGVFEAFDTRRKMTDLIPSKAKWIKASVATFQPENNTVTLNDGREIGYEFLVAAPGLQLDFDQIEGLTETLGKNGVTTNYLYQFAPYTWELAQNLKKGTAIFTQPPMPIKCAGAPQKAMYLSADFWKRSGVLKNIDVKFCNTGGVIFGVKDFVPALTKYLERYGVEANYGEQLVKVDGPKQTAWFKSVGENGTGELIERKFDMLHVVPPQSAPDFIKTSPLAAESGWIDVDQHTLQHTKYPNIYGLGDATTTPNAKTMAAARKQAPIVATNIIFDMQNKTNARANYDGYGACPLTVERGKVVLAEFGYGGKLLPSLPTWMLKGTKPTRLAWFMKDSLLPGVYWNQMLKGKEFLAKPEITLE